MTDPRITESDVKRLVDAIIEETYGGGDGELAIRWFITERLGLKIYPDPEKGFITGPTGPPQGRKT
jgi:hypothetical protein